MDEPFEAEPQGRGINIAALIFNLLTVVVLLATLCVGAAVAALFINPYMPYNPFPPPTLPPTLGPPTATSTPHVTLPPTWTPTATVTPLPSATPTLTPSPFPTDTPAPASEGTPGGPDFEVQEGSPVYVPNFVNEEGCNWMGIGGQVFDTEGRPVVGLGVHLEGTLGGQFISLDTLSGSAPALGPSGYLFDLGNQPVASEGTLWLQLNDTAGVPLSDQFFVTTTESCEENLVLVNWRQVR